LSKFIFTLGLLALLTVQVQADGRRYVWTYEYQTMPRGHAEMENYTEFSHVETDSGRLGTSKLQLEYEIGMNDRFDVGIYQVLKQNPGSPLQYDGFKLRFRYRIGEKGRLPLDPLLYLEYKDNASFDHSALEAKLILARDWGKFNMALNPIVEIEFEAEGIESKYEYTAGFGYEIHPLLTLSLEVKGSETDFYWGPTLSHGKEDLWFGIGLLNKGSETSANDRMIRMIIGLGL
jgi:hypothetical protein